MTPQIETSVTLFGGEWKNGRREGVLPHYDAMNYNPNNVIDPLRVENVGQRENITFSCSPRDKHGIVYLTFFHANGTEFRHKPFLYSDFDLGWGSWILTAMHPTCATLGQDYFENEDGERISFGQNNRSVQSFLEIPSWLRFMSCSEGGKLEIKEKYSPTHQTNYAVEFTGTFDRAKGEVRFNGKTYRRSLQVIRIKR